MKDATAGIAACQVHGLGKPNLAAPSYYNYEGLVLRGQRDGAVVRRQVFWSSEEKSRNEPPTDFAAPVATDQPDGYPWELFTDQPQE
jgi:hypothetical protein